MGPKAAGRLGRVDAPLEQNVRSILVQNEIAVADEAGGQRITGKGRGPLDLGLLCRGGLASPRLDLEACPDRNQPKLGTALVTCPRASGSKRGLVQQQPHRNDESAGASPRDLELTGCRDQESAIDANTSSPTADSARASDPIRPSSAGHPISGAECGTTRRKACSQSPSHPPASAGRERRGLP